eukprot:Cvel_29386.t1-p1 / transcript=Cvel_29386.t1 / gene=Cvel_29386 / organism=Chromera_velia_CCMP2878 / gene_product=hypothetical protein / transcript_product=hypothetical protein / location=Cvel_scaffold4007:28-454(-) / protein_length=100 / sequence_SO=supercontig / SO=protein_coding / is_pseudo=false
MAQQPKEAGRSLDFDASPSGLLVTDIEEGPKPLPPSSVPTKGGGSRYLFRNVSVPSNTKIPASPGDSGDAGDGEEETEGDKLREIFSKSGRPGSWPCIPQ